MKFFPIKTFIALAWIVLSYSCKVQIQYKPIVIDRAALSNTFTTTNKIIFQPYYTAHKAKFSRFDLVAYAGKPTDPGFMKNVTNIFVARTRDTYVSIKKQRKMVDEVFGVYYFKKGLISDTAEPEYRYLLLYPTQASKDTNYVKYKIYYALNNHSLPTDANSEEGRNYFFRPNLIFTEIALNPSPPRHPEE